MDEQTESRRIQPGDALAVWLDDLVRTAPEAARDALVFERWFASSVDLLACVPDRGQRLSWAFALVQPLPPGFWGPTVMMGELLRHAEEVRRCRVS